MRRRLILPLLLVPSLFVATVSAIYGLGEPESYFKMVLHLVKGDMIDQRLLVLVGARCAARGQEREPDQAQNSQAISLAVSWL